MKARRPFVAKFMALVVGLALCGIPECAQALGQDGGASAQNGQPQQQQSNAASPQTGQQQQQSNGASPQNSQQQQTQDATVDPSHGPLQPVPDQNQPSAQPNQNGATTPEPLPATPEPQQQMQQPLGTATAEGVPVVGGGASRPAGAAIAPAKQNQRRSWLIKLGVLAAVGVAGGTVYALTKGTPSHP